MKKKEKEKINQLAKKELLIELAKQTQELSKLVVEKSLGRLKNARLVGRKRDKIALIKTKIREKELEKK